MGVAVQVVELWTSNIAAITAESGIVPNIKVGNKYTTTGKMVRYVPSGGATGDYGWLTTGNGTIRIGGDLTQAGVNRYNIAVLYDTREFAVLDNIAGKGTWRILREGECPIDPWFCEEVIPPVPNWALLTIGAVTAVVISGVVLYKIRKRKK